MKTTETYEIAGKSFPITGYAKDNEDNKVPIVDIPMMSDFKWQLGCLKSRLENPESYAEHLGEDVPAAIEELKMWLLNHTSQATNAELKLLYALLHEE